MTKKKTPVQIQREIDKIIKTGTPLRRVIATRAKALRATKDAERDGLIRIGDDEGEVYDIEAEIAKIAKQAGVDPRMVEPRRAYRKVKSTAILALAAIGIGAAISIGSSNRPRR